MLCESTADVGDLVYLSNITPNKVEIVQDNNTPSPVIGIIVSKPTSTKAVILFDGIIKVGTIIDNGRLFVSTSGGFTLSDPAVNYTQLLGLSFGDGHIDFSPQLRVKRS